MVATTLFGVNERSWKQNADVELSVTLASVMLNDLDSSTVPSALTNAYAMAVPLAPSVPSVPGAPGGPTTPSSEASTWVSFAVHVSTRSLSLFFFWQITTAASALRAASGATTASASPTASARH